jgi:hypothetical protein
MKIIEIGFSRNKHNLIGSNLIMKYLGADYSHCYIKLQFLDNLNCIYHSTIMSGVTFTDINTFNDNNVIIKTFKILVDDVCYTDICKGLLQNSGKRYGFVQNLGIALSSVIKRIFNVTITNPFTVNQNCSELVYRRVICKLYPDIAKRYDPNLITPTDIDEILTEISKTDSNVSICNH